MKRAWLLIPILLLAGCAEEPAGPVSTEDPPAGVATANTVVLDRIAPSAAHLQLLAMGMHRTSLPGGLAHYALEVPLGHGPYDVVRIHRVVKERRPHRPVRTSGAVFMTHGASLDFESIFLDAGAATPSPETSVALYLADRGVDVWGMDFAWTLVPEATTDFAFMGDWGIDRDVSHTLAAMSVARLLRGLSGQGFEPIHLLGFSYGAAVAYGAAARETRQPAPLRDVRGIIPVDLALKYPDAAAAAPFGDPCDEAAAILALIESGDYVNPGGRGLGTLPAATAVFIGARTYQTNAREYWHFVAGADTGSGIELLDTDVDRWLRFIQALPPYMPRRVTYERAAAACPDGVDVGWDDQLDRIAVPILYLGAAGAGGAAGYYTAELTDSEDVTTHTVSIPGRSPETDFGHADLFMADAAPGLVWSVLGDWLVDQDRARRSRHGRR